MARSLDELEGRKMARSLDELDASFQTQYQKGKSKVQKSGIIFYAVLLLMVGSTMLLSCNAIGLLSFGSYKTSEILEESMESIYPIGSLIIAKKVDPNELKIGDDITFMKNAKTILTERIIEIEEDYVGTGERIFITKGVDITRGTPEMVAPENVIGKVTNSIPRAGAFFSLLGKTLWMLPVLILVVIVGSFVYRAVRGKRDKKEDSERTIV